MGSFHHVYWTVLLHSDEMEEVCVNKINRFVFFCLSRLTTGVGTARASSPVRWPRDAASPVTEAGTGPAVTSSAPKASLAKTAKKCVPPAKTVTTAIPSMASALTVTLAGLGTGKETHTQSNFRHCVKAACHIYILLFSQTFWSRRALSFSGVKT